MKREFCLKAILELSVLERSSHLSVCQVTASVDCCLLVFVVAFVG